VVQRAGKDSSYMNLGSKRSASKNSQNQSKYNQFLNPGTEAGEGVQEYGDGVGNGIPIN